MEIVPTNKMNLLTYRLRLQDWNQMVVYDDCFRIYSVLDVRSRMVHHQ